ncbi:vitellogenin 3, phosvitinless [Salminus brasiliensis]|uniref:vitellogenin 3, phosvitinless n=1 Tax=Salminus brasiliensis TaxID=930266 RepID=UPI003B82E6B6
MMPKHVIALQLFIMRLLLYCLFAASAASETINYEPTLNFKKTYEYKYEGVVNVGRDMADLAEAGVKLQCTFRITGVSLQLFLLQISGVEFEEFNGIAGESSFKASPSLSKRLTAELNRPFTFQYSNGQVVDIQTAAEVPDTIVNIVRGILGFLHVTVKTTQQVYELNELGIHGVCHSAYAVEENAAAKELYVTQVVDISNCLQKAAVYSGMALAGESKNSKQRGENVVATVTYAYTVKSTETGGLITQASAQERHHFSPFNVKGGNTKVKAVRNIVLLKQTNTVGKPVTGQVKSRGNLMYKVVKSLGPMPVLLINLTNPVAKISDLIKHLAQSNIYQVDHATSADVLALIQLLRTSTYEDLELLWKQLSGNSEHRRWFLDTVVEVTDERLVKFLKSRFKAGDISANEAGQAILLALNHLSAEPELAEMAKEFLTIPFSKSHPLLWNTVVLSYGSLAYRVYAHVNPCPVVTVQPLLDMAINGLTKNNEGEMVLALKALGNAGHPLSIKTILKFLPGFSVKADSLSTRVQSVAVQALRHLAIRDPNNVQDIALTIFAERTLPAEIRMLASMILLETKPPVALISAVADLLLQENNLQVGSFTYSQLRALSRSRTPDNQYLSTACNIAVKILARKFGHLSYRYSKALHLDWFHDDLLTGTSSEFYLLRNGTSAIPTQIISKGKLHFIGRILQLVELGVRAEGLKELFTDKPGITKQFGIADFAAIMKILSDWQSLPKDKPLLSVYARVFGQEVSFMDLDRDVIQQILKSVSLTASKENKIWNIIQYLQKGTSWHWTKPSLMLETRFIQPTCLGLPVEMSKYFSTVTAITANAKVVINPPPKESLRELINADVSLQTDGFYGAAKDILVFNGINTDLFQCGAQLNSKIVTALPWKIELKKKVKEWNFEVNLDPCKRATELLSVNSNVYAVSRNIEDPSSARMTPMMPEGKDLKQSFPKDQKIPNNFIFSQVEDSEIYHPKLQYCSEASVYGAALCTQAEANRAHYLKEYPLYYFLGFTQFSCHFEPVMSINPIEKLQVQIRVGHNKHKPDLSQMLTHSLTEGTDAAPDPVISVSLLAVSPNEKVMGYEVDAYYTLAKQRKDMELILSEVAEEGNWKICADLCVDEIQEKAKAHFKWGAECQPYEIALKVSTAGIAEPKPSITADVNWGDVPSFIQAFGKRVREYFPGVSYVMGFYQKHEKNTDHEVSATLVASTQEGFDVKVKIPELTVYRKEIPSPFELVVAESDDNSGDMSHI